MWPHRCRLPTQNHHELLKLFMFLFNFGSRSFLRLLLDLKLLLGLGVFAHLSVG
jgi:hypothetical protein